jgi:two-component system, chemotaxis family, sensor kinase CheA
VLLQNGEQPPRQKPVAKLRAARTAQVRARSAVAFYKRTKGKKSEPEEPQPPCDAPLSQDAPLSREQGNREQGNEFPDLAGPFPDIASLPSSTPAPDSDSAYLSGELDLVADFTVEAREHIASIEKGLLRLEQNPEDKDAIHSVFRAFHSIKGLAGFLALNQIQTLTHEVETLLEEVRNGRYALDSALVDVVLQSADYVSRSLTSLDALVAGKQVPLPPLDAALVDLVRAVHQGKERKASAGQAATPEPPQAAATQGAPPQGTGEGVPAHRASEASRVKVDTRKLDLLVEMVGELVVAQSLLRHDERLKIDVNAPIALKISQMARITSEVQQITMAMRMVPIQGLFQKTARLARDLSRKSGKLVEFVTSGEDTELDRNIVEELADPLVHMIRNSMDHGLEAPEERVRAGKSATGKVGLRASHQAGMIVVEIFDDGRGLDAAKLRTRGIERGLINENSSYSEEELFGLIFEPGFSTAAKVTDISGRGVGMDVVKRHIERLRGRIDIRSQLGAGATFLLKLPLTLAIIDGLVVGVGGERYVVPIVAVREMFRPAKNTVTSIEGNREMVRLRDQVMPVVRLSERFGIRAANQSLEQSLLIVTETESRTFSLVVDELLGRQEVVIKSLGEVFGNVAGVAGGAILGDGRVGLILDPKGVFESGAKQAATLHA